MTTVSFYHFMQLWLCFWSWFFESFFGGGKINKVHVKKKLSKKNFPFKSYDMKLVFAKNGQLLSLLGTRKKYIFFPIRVVNFCKTFCIYFPSSLGKDLTVKNTKKNYYFFIWASWAKNGNLEFFLKKQAFVF